VLEDIDRFAVTLADELGPVRVGDQCLVEIAGQRLGALQARLTLCPGA